MKRQTQKARPSIVYIDDEFTVDSYDDIFSDMLANTRRRQLKKKQYQITRLNPLSLQLRARPEKQLQRTFHQYQYYSEYGVLDDSGNIVAVIKSYPEKTYPGQYHQWEIALVKTNNQLRTITIMPTLKEAKQFALSYMQRVLG